MNNIVISGATSMLGIATIKSWLQNDANIIYALVRPKTVNLSRIPKNEHIYVIECDVDEYKNLPKRISQQCDLFYHFAWTNTDNRNKDIPAQAQNICFTLDALKASCNLGCKHFIGAGSQAEFGAFDVDKISANMICNPIEPYGVAKYAAGKLAMAQAGCLDMICSWVRVFSVYGENDKSGTMIMSVLRKMINNEHISATLGFQRWDYLNCKDAGRAFVLVGSKAKQSDIYCLGSGKAYLLRKYFEIMKRITNSSSSIGYGEIPYKDNQVMNLCADIKELRELGWQPQISFEDGIREMYIKLYKGGGKHAKLSNMFMCATFVRGGVHIA